MAVFDVGSAVSGASAGAAFGGPIGATIGGLFGGFAGGGAREAEKRRIAKLNKMLAYINSPEFIRANLPTFLSLTREQLANSGTGAAFREGFQNTISSLGLRGTSLEPFLSGTASSIPELSAFDRALGLVQNFQENERARVANAPFVPSATPATLANLQQIAGLFTAQGGMPFFGKSNTPPGGLSTGFGLSGGPSGYSNNPISPLFYGPAAPAGFTSSLHI